MKLDGYHMLCEIIGIADLFNALINDFFWMDI